MTIAKIRDMYLGRWCLLAQRINGMNITEKKHANVRGKKMNDSTLSIYNAKTTAKISRILLVKALDPKSIKPIIYIVRDILTSVTKDLQKN